MLLRDTFFPLSLHSFLQWPTKDYLQCEVTEHGPVFLFWSSMLLLSFTIEFSFRSFVLLFWSKTLVTWVLSVLTTFAHIIVFVKSACVQSMYCIVQLLSWQINVTMELKTYANWVLSLIVYNIPSERKDNFGLMHVAISSMESPPVLI